MTKNEFELLFSRKTLRHKEKGCYRKLQQVFGDYTLEVIKLYPILTLDFGDEVFVIDLIRLRVNGDREMFQNTLHIYQNHLRQLIANSIIDDFNSGELIKYHGFPILDVEKYITDGINE